MSDKNVVPFAPKAGALASQESLQASLNTAIVESGQGSTTEPILRLGRDGAWIYGSDSVEPEVGAEWAINPYSLQHGYICWGDNADLLGEVMVPIGQARPAKSELPNHGEFSWNDQFSCDMACLTGEDEGQQVVYKPSSVGGRRAMSELMKVLSARIGEVGVEGEIVPVVKLETQSYNHKKYGKIYNPILEVVRWISINGDTAEDEAEPEAKPTRRRRSR
jgi:hypothetical protein